MYNEWQRPKTSRLYLQPPKSERFYTLWREGKVVFGSNQQPITDYDKQFSAGIWFTDMNDRAFDYHKGAFFVREDGIPVHSVKHKLGNKLFVTVESFAAPGRHSVCYVRLTVKNPAETELRSRIGFVLRSAAEQKLLFQSPDLYASYDPDLTAWHQLPSTWQQTEYGYTDGEHFLRCESGLPFVFDQSTGTAAAELCLAPGESVEAVFAYDAGRVPDLDYCRERENTIAFWEKELARIQFLPEKIAADPEKARLIKNLTVQILQCFCHMEGSDILLARQGGLQRQIWAYESMPVLEGLSRIGSFDDYIEPIIDTYFGEFYSETGEITPLSISWAMITSNALYSFAKYARMKGKEYFGKYRDRALGSFRWIKTTRASSASSDNLVPGLFPPMSSCDDPLVFQSWCNTDTFNLRGIKALAETFEYFNDEAAQEIREEYADYLGCMRSLWQKFSDAETSDEIAIPYCPNLPDEVIIAQFLFPTPVGYFAEGIDMDVKDASRVLKYYTNKGFIKGGLYDRMRDHTSVGSAKQNLDEDGKCLVWYVCCHEYYWFLYFLRHGMTDKCEEIVADALRFAITDEYYMIERYHQRDPWFSPWSPNASANGRTINMLLDLCCNEQ